MICLALETATTNCSVALFNDEELIGYKEVDSGYSHAENLHVFIEELLQKHKIEFKDLDSVAVGSGPGSYTGLRIGLAAAKGLCFALNIPLIAINTLESMVVGVQEYLRDKNLDTDVLFCPMIDARRMEVYTMLTDYNLETLIPTTAMIINEDCELVKYDTKNTIVYFGNGAKKCEPLLFKHSNFQLLEPNFNTASARFMGKLINHKFINQYFEDVAYYEPNYLKEFQTTTPKKLL